MTNIMFFATIFIATGGLKAVYAAWHVQEADRLSFLVATQRMRYTFLMVGLASSAGFGYYLVVAYGWNAFFAGVDEWMSIPVIGWIVGICMYYALISPIVALLTAWHIYHHPSTMAHRVNGGYVKTRDVRDAASGSMIVYTKDAQAYDGRNISSCFVPTGRMV